MQNQKSPPELPNSWRTGHAPLMSHLIIARTVGPRRQVFLQGGHSWHSGGLFVRGRCGGSRTDVPDGLLETGCEHRVT